MANTQEQFEVFHDRIELHASKEANLQRGRDAIRDVIRDSFRDKKRSPVPEFCAQGSFAMRTTVNPIDGEYDLDDGVYLQNLPQDDQAEWPTPAEVHQWIIEAVDGHTEQKPIDKTSCVRVVYAGQYHIDLPIYADLNGKNMHAETGAQGWHVSDPVEITKWFQNKIKQHGEQLRRIVRYLKAWADFKSDEGKIGNSLLLTTLAAQNFVPNERDDVSLARTVQAISTAISNSMVIPNPADEREDLASRLDDKAKGRLKNAVCVLAGIALRALAEVRLSTATGLWQGQLGDRFPVVTDKDEEDQRRADVERLAPAFVGRVTKPWAL